MPMKDHDGDRHPGPWRVMSVDSETAGILVAVGFLAMGLVSIPVARWFVVACIIVLIVVVLWWAGRNDRKLYRRVQSMSNQLTLPLRCA